MSDRYEINEGDCYRHILTHTVVQVTRVRWHEGFTGSVYWETLSGSKIDGVTSGIQEAQHFLEDFYLIHVPNAVAYSSCCVAEKVLSMDTGDYAATG